MSFGPTLPPDATASGHSGRKKRLRSPGQVVGPRGKEPHPASTPQPPAPPARAADAPVNNTGGKVADEAVARSTATTVTFVFPGGERRDACVRALLDGASPGWLTAAIPELEDGAEVDVAVETPLAGVELQARAFRLLLLPAATAEFEAARPLRRAPVGPCAARGPPSARERTSVSSLEEAAAGRLKLLPHAFLAAHVLGMERLAASARALFLRRPAEVLKSLRLRSPRRTDYGHAGQTEDASWPGGDDGEALRRALDLGFAHAPGSAPLRRGVAEQLEAAELALRWHLACDSSLAALLSGGPPLRLLHLFRAACDMRLKELQSEVRTYLSAAVDPQSQRLRRLLHAVELGPGFLRDECGVSEAEAGIEPEAGAQQDHSSSSVEALRCAVIGGIDREAGLLVAHAAAAEGLLGPLCLSKSAGQGVNSRSRLGRKTPAMLAAAGGHAAVLRWLARNGADLTARDDRGCCVHDLALDSGDASVLRLLNEPLLRLAVPSSR
eukprot:gnl/TRDRNA2_/TRDRNA2_143971_c0_seq1.p1 gnl/TRDRNA2_/TRDRNA2_143971_c0~~gnl/TRDRNA2_/TRDRNA2_143971_c0_seq1.p1  ORF type:complete len:509 (-),score=79.03 gnl/TRDRNA2_/TRDRNA2_143971_c0_seq1:17-1510(-)